MNGILRAAFIIAVKDLRQEFRTRESIYAAAAFLIMVVLTFRFAFHNERATPSLLAALWWSTFFICSFFGPGNSFGREKEQNCLEGLLLAPVDRRALFLGKLFSAAVLLGLFMPVAALILFIFWDYPLQHYLPGLAAAAAVGISGMVLTGTMVSALTLRCRNSSMLLPVLLLPLLAFTYLMPLVRATIGVLEGMPPAQYLPLLRPLLGFSVIYLVVFMSLFKHTVVD